ncbi:MAG TPA: zinc ribbon domain-containing protein [Candidatus Scybalousia intestinigallinarum]|nr:zinc ribbon domain-containing protein [Candidatus Scybalousia intestinigallinarum]
MKCPKCSAEIMNDAKFCPYCGEHLSTYDDPFASYRVTSLWEDKEDNAEKQSSKKERIQYVDSPRFKQNYEVDNRFSYLAIVLSILAIPLCFFKWGLGLLLACIAFILCLVNLKRASKGVKVSSLLFSIFGGITTIILSIILAVFSIHIVLDNGYSTTIGDYFKDAFMAGYYEQKIYGYWVNEDNQLLYLSDIDDKYYLYFDRRDTSSDYLTGSIYASGGYSISRDGDVIFADQDYYYYWVDTSLNLEYSSGESSLSSYFQDGFLIKLDKENYNRLILYIPRTLEVIEFTREQSTV